MLVLPLGNALLYVEPIYLQAESGRIPELKRVIVASGDQVIMADTLGEGLVELIGGMRPPALAEIVPPAKEGDGNAKPPAVDQSVRQLAESASAHYEAAQEASRAGDWAKYGEELDALEADLNKLLETIEK